MDQREHLTSRPRCPGPLAEPDDRIDERLKPEPSPQRHREHEPGIDDDPLIIEDNRRSVRQTVHHAGDLLMQARRRRNRQLSACSGGHFTSTTGRTRPPKTVDRGLDEVVAFYRDGLGLTEIGGFRGHDGYDGVFLEVPGTNAHLEFTAGGGHGAPSPHPESLLVLYLGNAEAARAVASRLGVDAIAPANPYWAEHGTTFQDPDGFRVVLVPEAWEP